MRNYIYALVVVLLIIVGCTAKKTSSEMLANTWM
jgi:uncharacterized protein YcfL